MGIAFQLQDDLLDVYGDETVFGKKIGGDILCNKKTYLLIKAFELADKEQGAQLTRWIAADSTDPVEKVAAVTTLYNQIGVKDCCEKKMEEYYERAICNLTAVAVEEKRKYELRRLVDDLMHRNV